MSRPKLSFKDYLNEVVKVLEICNEPITCYEIFREIKSRRRISPRGHTPPHNMVLLVRRAVNTGVQDGVLKEHQGKFQFNCAKLNDSPRVVKKKSANSYRKSIKSKVDSRASIKSNKSENREKSSSSNRSEVVYEQCDIFAEVHPRNNSKSKSPDVERSATSLADRCYQIPTTSQPYSRTAIQSGVLRRRNSQHYQDNVCSRSRASTKSRRSQKCKKSSSSNRSENQCDIFAEVHPRNNSRSKSRGVRSRRNSQHCEDNACSRSDASIKSRRSQKRVKSSSSNRSDLLFQQCDIFGEVHPRNNSRSRNRGATLTAKHCVASLTDRCNKMPTTFQSYSRNEIKSGARRRRNSQGCNDSRCIICRSTNDDM